MKLNADQMGTARRPSQSNQGVLPFDNPPNKPLVRANGIRAALGNRTPDYALRASPVVHGRNGWCEMPLATARLAMTRRGRIVACGTNWGHRSISLEILQGGQQAMPELSF